MRELLGEMAERLRMLDDCLRPYDQRIERLCQQDERCRRLVKVEGVGPLVATALVAAIGNARQFKSGRELSAWLGLVPPNTPVASAPCCLGSASVAIVICARCSSTEHALPHAWPSANATLVASG